MQAAGRRAPRFSWPAFFAVIALLYFFYKIHAVLIPFVLSFALAYLVDPIIHHFEADGLRREHIVLALYCVIAAGIAMAANFLLPAMMSELSLLQGRAGIYYAAIQHAFSVFQADLARRMPFGQYIVEKMSMRMYNPLMEQLPKLPSYILGLFPLFSLIFLVPFISFFMLMDAERLMQDAIQACPSRRVE